MNKKIKGWEGNWGSTSGNERVKDYLRVTILIWVDNRDDIRSSRTDLRTKPFEGWYTVLVLWRVSNCHRKKRVKEGGGSCQPKETMWLWDETIWAELVGTKHAAIDRIYTHWQLHFLMFSTWPFRSWTSYAFPKSIFLPPKSCSLELYRPSCHLCQLVEKELKSPWDSEDFWSSQLPRGTDLLWQDVWSETCRRRVREIINFPEEWYLGLIVVGVKWKK